MEVKIKQEGGHCAKQQCTEVICHTFELGVDLTNVSTNELANEQIMAACV